MRGVAGTDGLTRLTAREQEVLELMAEGFSNRGICARLCLSPKTVEAHVRNIFRALGIEQSSDYHRRVLAVLFHVHVSH
jgi:serine/threonine-protein kinase